jgi:monothiol glutaredoxin
LWRHFGKIGIERTNTGAGMSIHDTIRDQISKSRVVLYMKGTPDFPQCGFSATAAEILRRCGVNEYASYNVLDDDALRQGIKEYSSWPTIPQLYVNGEFVGGCDIMREMYQSGELQQLFERSAA